MKKLYLNIKKIFFDTKCILCDNESDDKIGYLCYNCYTNMKMSSSVKNISEYYYIWDYNKIYSKIIFDYKYENVKKISNIFSELIKDKLFYVLEKEEIDYIFPIPITKHKLSLRGFNQTEEILKKMNIKYEKSERVKETKAMYTILSKEKREKNILNAFEIIGSKNLNNKNIMIFDDIITTGATTKEFEKMLRKKWNINKLIVFSCMAAKTMKKTKIQL